VQIVGPKIEIKKQGIFPWEYSIHSWKLPTHIVLILRR
jgi:hypothetical protein